MTANSRGGWDVSSGLGGFHLKNTLSGHYRNWLSVGRAVRQGQQGSKIPKDQNTENKRHG